MPLRIPLVKPYFFTLILLTAAHFVYSQPQVKSFSPLSGPIGSSVTLTGSGFDPAPANNRVRFGDIQAVVTAATATSLTVTVPAGASYEPITVTNLINNLRGDSYLPFNVTLTTPTRVDTGMYTSQFRATGELLRPQATDLNGDGLADLVYQYNATVRNELIIRKSVSAPGYLFFSDSLVINMNGGAPPSGKAGNVVLTDMDGDSRPDIVALHLASSGLDEVYVYRNTSTLSQISFDNPVKLSTRSGFSATRVWVHDLDGDGKADIVLDGGGLVVYRNTSLPAQLLFGSQQVITQSKDIVGFADMDGDGLTDALLTDNFNLVIWKNTSVPGSILWGALSQVYQNDFDHYITSWSFGDFNSDGKTDLLLVNSTSTSGWFATLVNNSVPGTYAFNTANYGVEGLPTLGVIGDVDGDGKPDVLVSDKSLPRFTLYRNESLTPNFLSLGFRRHFPARASYTYGITSADMDTDGKLDILLGGSGLEIFRYSNVLPPAVSPSGPVSFCIFDSVLLQASPATNVSWYKGTTLIQSGTPTLWVKESGTFSAAITVSGVISPLSEPVLATANLPAAKPTISVDGSGAMVSSFGQQYQWYEDPATIIPGATSSSYKPSKAGLFRVRIWVNGCASPLSDAYSYSPTAIMELGNGQSVKIYPNPVRDRLYLQYAGNRPATYTLKLFSMDGRLVLQQGGMKTGSSVSMQKLPAGSYQLFLLNEQSGRSISTVLLHD